MKRAILLLVVFALLAALVLAVMPAQAQGEFDAGIGTCCRVKALHTNECIKLHCTGADVLEWDIYFDDNGVRVIKVECKQSPAGAGR